MLNLSCDQTLLSLKKQNSLGENAETISGRGQRNWSQKTYGHSQADIALLSPTNT